VRPQAPLLDRPARPGAVAVEERGDGTRAQRRRGEELRGVVRQRREQSAEIGVRVARGGVVEVDDGQMTVAEQLEAGDPGPRRT